MPHHDEVEREFEDHRRCYSAYNGAANSDPESASLCKIEDEEKSNHC